MNNSQNSTIEVVFEESCAKYGAEIVKWLMEDGIVKQSEPPTVTAGGLFHYTFVALRQIAMDSLIVFVSDEATANKDWFSCVDSVSENKRVIPVGSVEAVDYNDPQVIPPRIEEINFIRIDEDLQRNILDSLTTDPDFYSIKNRLLMRCRYWAFSHNTRDLLTNLKQIKSYKKIVNQKMKDENDSNLRSQLTEIQEYLDASEQYAKTILKQDIIIWTRRSFAIVVALVMLFGFFKVKDFYHRLSYAKLASSVDINSVDAQTGAIKMAEILSNPLSDTSSKKLAFENIVGLLDKVWSQTPVGMNYKNTINDVAIPSGERYVWTADSGGRIICWDTYTGLPEHDTKVCDSQMVALSVSKSDHTFVALSDTGRIFCAENADWHDTGAISQINVNRSQVKTTDDTILIFDDEMFEIFTLNGILLASDKHKDCQILDIDFISESEILIAESKNGILNVSITDFKHDTSSTAVFDNIKIGLLSKADFFSGLLIVSDENGQVWKISEMKATETALLLPKTISLELIDLSTVVYHERNMGTGIYDIEDSFDYGDVLSDIRAINQLYVSDSLVVAQGSSCFDVYPIKQILKKTKSETTLSSAAVVYDQPQDSTDQISENQPTLQHVEITPGGVIILDIHLKDSNSKTTAALDPAKIMDNESGRSSSVGFSEIPEDALIYDDESFSANGLPVVVGIRSKSDDSLRHTDYDSLVVGCKDGSFAELFLGSDGSILQTVSHVIPSRCAITAIYPVENGYVLEDEYGRLWDCNDGTELIEENGFIKAIKDKMHSAVADDLKELISPELWNALDLKTFPGGANKMWE